MASVCLMNVFDYKLQANYMKHMHGGLPNYFSKELRRFSLQNNNNV